MAWGDEHRVYLETPDIGDMPWLACEKRGCDWSVRIKENSTPADLLELEKAHDQEVMLSAKINGRTIPEIFETLEYQDRFLDIVALAMDATVRMSDASREATAKYIGQSIDDLKPNRTIRDVSTRKVRDVFDQVLRIAKTYTNEQRAMLKHVIISAIKREF